MYHLQSLEQRIQALFFIVIVAVLIITARLFYLQIHWSDHYIHRGNKNFLRVETVLPHRGTIYDCHGNLLATNRPIHHLLWRGTGNAQLNKAQLQRLKQIEQIISTSISAPSLLQAERHYKQIELARDITFDQLSRITELYPEDPNISISTQFERYYPYGSYASHVVGYLSRQIDTPSYGKMGIEKICDDLLKGQEGTLLKTINSIGQDVTTLQLNESLKGKDIQVTLDIDLQRIAERIYPVQQVGCFLIMDPEDGAIKAVVSRPSFDPGMFLKPISYQTWQELQHKQPFLNRTLNPYPPGSIFKLVTISAALEHGFLHPDQMWHCNGFVQFAKRKYWCNRRWGHGEISTTQAVAQSCNVLFYEIGKKIDIDLLAKYAHKFGLGNPTGSAFLESTGIVPSREWKLEYRGEPWWPGETLSVTIGQSFLLCTPLQVVRMISAIFTGYLAKPRILQNESIETMPLTLAPETIEFLKQSMRCVVTRGTGKRISTIKDIEIYAKTSTAQIADLSKRKLSSAFLEHAWFVAYFQYKSFKPLVFLILVENAGTSQVATTIAKQFLIAYKDLMLYQK